MQTFLSDFSAPSVFSGEIIKENNHETSFREPEALVRGFTNITEAVVEKLSEVVKDGDIANQMSERSRSMR